MSGLLAATTLLLVGCGGESASSDNAATLTDQDMTREDLVALAEDEGTVSLYTSVAGPTADALADAFEKAYPAIEVEVFTGNLDVLASKVASEHQAGQVAADVIEADNFGLLSMQEQGLLQSYHAPSAADLPADSKTAGEQDGENYYVSDRVLYISMGYNPEELNGVEPADLDDLLRPELRGRMAVAQGTVAARWVGGVLNELGEEEGTEYVRALGEQDVKLAPVTTAALADLLVAGQYAATPALLSNAVAMRPDAPLEWRPIGTAVASTGSVAVADGARHPAAAALLADFLIGPEGQAVYGANGYTSPAEEVGFPTCDPLSAYASSEDFEAAYAGWQQLLEEHLY